MAHRRRIVAGMVVARLRQRLHRRTRHAVKFEHALGSDRASLCRRVEAIHQILRRRVVLPDSNAQALPAELGHGAINHDDIGLSRKDRVGGETQRAGNAAAVGPNQSAKFQFARAECRHQLLAIVALGAV